MGAAGTEPPAHALNRRVSDTDACHPPWHAACYADPARRRVRVIARARTPFEQVYRNHRTWPTDNPGAKPPLSAVNSDEAIQVRHNSDGADPLLTLDDVDRERGLRQEPAKLFDVHADRPGAAAVPVEHRNQLVVEVHGH